MTKHFIPIVCAEGRWVYMNYRGREDTFHPDVARQLGRMLIDAADNTESEEPSNCVVSCEVTEKA